MSTLISVVKCIIRIFQYVRPQERAGSELNKLYYVFMGYDIYTRKLRSLVYIQKKIQNIVLITYTLYNYQVRHSIFFYLMFNVKCFKLLFLSKLFNI